MENLDNRIYNIFKFLVESGTKYITELNYGSHNIQYLINGKNIILSAFTKSKEDKYIENSFSNIVTLYKRGGWPDYSWELLHCDPKTELEFIITINSKQYRVYGLSRVEYAMVLDSLDNTIKEWEDKQLSSIESVLFTDVEDNLD